MKYIIPMLLLLVCADTYAGHSFDQRAQNAHRLERQSNQSGYQNALHRSLMPKMRRIMSACSGEVHGSKPDPFSLVGDITHTSTLINIQVRPADGFSKCFANGLANVSMPALPDNYKGKTYPFTMDFHFH